MTGKLYPPNISGTLPSFYSNTEGTVLTVPFSMNRTVSLSQVTGVSLRLKTAYTDKVLGIFSGSIQNQNEINNLQAIFNVDAVAKSSLVQGEYYKAQIAYIDADGIVGYYSTIGVVKYTSQPSVEIVGFTIATTNINPTNYVGAYYNAGDTTERVYQYRFILYTGDEKIIEDSGWLLHNSYKDENVGSSIDEYIIKYSFELNKTYKVQYLIKTNNNLEVRSSRYLVMEANSANPELEGTFTASLDYDNACVSLSILGKKDNKGNEGTYAGSFVVSRANSLDNYRSWTTITYFSLAGQVPSIFQFNDFTIEQGTTYKYSIQQYNDSGIYSNRILSNEIIAEFEDMFLYENGRQLRIRFNPKVSSFKTTLLENKKNTIGSKYPYIFRNGAVQYKEFPIAGLISYMIDQDNFFISNEEIGKPEDWRDTIDITDQNIAIERRFKLAVLDWLNNGNVKLFKSPTEGNYLVRLMNNSLTPVEQVGRMIHSFSSSATEIAEYSDSSLSEFGMLNNIMPVTKQMRWETTNFRDLVASIIAEKEQKYATLTASQRAENIISDIGKYDILRSYPCEYIKIEDAPLGLGFILGSMNFIVGVTGQYEATLDNSPSGLRFADPQWVYYNKDILQGQVTCGIMSTTSNRFDTIGGVSFSDIAIHQEFGPSDDILAQFRDDVEWPKRQISRIYFARFSPINVEPVASREELQKIVDRQFRYNSDAYEYIVDPYTIYETTAYNKDNDNLPIEHEYYKVNFDNGRIIDLPDYSTIVDWGGDKISVEQDNTIEIPDLDKLPSYCAIGSGVCAEISLQIREITYGIESKYTMQKKEVDSAYEDWRRMAVQLVPATGAYDLTGNTEYYVFDFNRFRILKQAEIAEYSRRNTNVYVMKSENDILYTDTEIQSAKNKYDTLYKEYLQVIGDALVEEEANKV